MHLQVIDTFEAFQDIRERWNALYEADPEANIFLSHQWLYDWLTFNRSAWFVLAAKQTAESADYLALLPLRIRPKFDRKVGLFNELYLAGAQFSDCTGLLCQPESETEVIPALAAYIKRKLHWAVFTLDNLMISERRRRLFASGLGKRGLEHKPLQYLDAKNNLDHGVFPIADLPDSWDGYLAKLSSNNRQKIRRLLKKVEGGGPYRIGILEGDQQIEGIDMLLDHWRTKWVPTKGEKTADEIVFRNREMLRRCSRNGTLFFPVFYHEDRPVAALATLIDRIKRSMHFFITGRDEAYSEMPAGYLLHAFSIRHAIAEGFRTYDFLRGNEPYKYHFATREAHMRAGVFRTLDRRNLGGVIDPRCLDEAIRMATGFDDDGETDDAATAYRQIIEAVPDHALVLYRLGRLFARKKDLRAAIPWLRQSVEAEPEGDNAWMWLARSLQEIGDLSPALDAWARLLELKPDHDEARSAVAELRVKTLVAPRQETLILGVGPAIAGINGAAEPAEWLALPAQKAATPPFALQTP